MTKGILGKKVGMTQIFTESGELIPVTVVEATPNVVLQVKTMETDGYEAIQVGYQDMREVLSNKPAKGHVAKANTAPKRFIREFKNVELGEYEVGKEITVDVFQAGDIIDVTGTTKGKGLGYIKLGQSSTTLSGGESQRVKLATELSKRDTGKTLYILDEPTTGLHFEDIRVLMGVLNKLVDKGNTVIVIEHNLDVIKMADYIIDMGPEGGKGGGELLSFGTPEEVAKSNKGYTPKFLREELKIN